MAYYSYPYQPNYFSNYPAQQQTQQSNGRGGAVAVRDPAGNGRAHDHFAGREPSAICRSYAENRGALVRL